MTQTTYTQSYTGIQGVSGIGNISVGAEYTSQGVEAQYFAYMSGLYAAYYQIAENSGNMAITNNLPSSTDPAYPQTPLPPGEDPYAYLAQNMAGLLQLAQNGIGGWYMTTNMVNVVNVLAATFQEAGITFDLSADPPTSNLTAGDPSGLVTGSSGWLSQVINATANPPTGIFAPVNATASAGNPVNLTPNIMQSSYVSEQINRDLQNMIATNYIANGNNILSAQLDGLQTQLTEAQTGVGILNQIQDLHNQVAAPPPNDVSAGSYPGDPTGFLSAASAAYGVNLTPLVTATTTTTAGNWVTYDPLSGETVPSGATQVTVNSSGVPSLSNFTDQANLLNYVNQLISTINALASAQGQSPTQTSGTPPPITSGSLAFQLEQVVNDIYSYTGVPAGAFYGGPPWGATPASSAILPTVPNTLVQISSKDSSGDTIYYGMDGKGNLITYNPSKIQPNGTTIFTWSQLTSAEQSFIASNSATGGSVLRSNMANSAVIVFPNLPNPVPDQAVSSGPPGCYFITNDSGTLTSYSVLPTAVVVPGLPNQSVYGWIMDGQSATSGGAVSSSGQIQNNLTTAITSGQNLNTQLSEKTQQYLFIFQEFYQSASGIITAINQFMQQITQNMGH